MHLPRVVEHRSRYAPHTALRDNKLHPVESISVDVVHGGRGTVACESVVSQAGCE